MNVMISKDADKLLCEIYAVYQNRRDNGESKKSAMEFLDESIWPNYDWNSEDSHTYMLDLKHAGLLKRFIYGGMALTDNAIIYMENRFKNGLKDTVKALLEVGSTLPSILGLLHLG